MKVQFCGAIRKVTGSCYFIETSTVNLVVDCGLHQGGRMSEDSNMENFPFDPSSVSAVFLTHAHLDHTGRVPKLVRDGFFVLFYATAPTARLAQLIMEDSVHILKSEAQRHKHDPIFTEEDVIRTQSMFEEIEYHQKIVIDDNVTVEFFDAGHILGSSIIRIEADGRSIIFSGDLGNPPVPLLKATETISEADYVVMESTYGARVHEDKDNRKLLLQSAIYETVMMKGVLMIPAFALERTQELLYELNEMVNNKDIPSVPIFLDSPLAIKATKIFKDFDSQFNQEAMEHLDTDANLFDFPGLKITLTTEESIAINEHPSPKIIIAGSGMAHGGRILHHIKRYISFFTNQYLIVGFQVKGSLGRKILDGDKTITVHGEEFKVKAKVSAIGGYSAHADQPKLVAWVSCFDKKKLKKVFVTHGEESQSLEFAQHLRRHLDLEAVVPEVNQIVELD